MSTIAFIIWLIDNIILFATAGCIIGISVANTKEPRYVGDVFDGAAEEIADLMSEKISEEVAVGERIAG